MSIGDEHTHDTTDLTVEHISRVNKARAKMDKQGDKILSAVDQLKRVAENRNTYAPTPDMWKDWFARLDRELNDLQATIERADRRQARGPRRWADL